MKLSKKYKKVMKTVKKIKNLLIEDQNNNSKLRVFWIQPYLNNKFKKFTKNLNLKVKKIFQIKV